MANFNPYSDARVIKFSDSVNNPPIVERNAMKSSNGYTYHTVKAGETIQSIAFQYYGDSGYWMRIAEANNIYNPFVELEDDTQIIIP